jgi:hypothetical protein
MLATEETTCGPPGPPLALEELSMREMKSVSTTRLIMVPALITLGITTLRLIGELQHWPKPWFSAAPGGGGALVGISWLPLIFGPYFALKLKGAGAGPSSIGRSIGFTVLGLAVLFLSGWWVESTFSHTSILTLLGFLLMLASAFIPRLAWRSLGNTLLAYAFAARIPVLVVMYLALRGNGGQGWGTHYDAVAPMFAHSSLAKKFFYEAFLPQMTMWIGWTVVVGSFVGVIATAVARPHKRTAQAPV